jgi:hypothetical protein
VKRLFAVLAAFFVAMTVGLAAPQAALANGAGYSCDNVDTNLVPRVRMCLYNWDNTATGGGFWQRSIDDLPGDGRGCVNLSQHAWHNGGSVNDASGSLILNVGVLGSGQYWKMRIYDWTNCSSANGYFDVYGSVNGSYTRYPDLDAIGWNDKIGSVQLFFYS